MNWLAGKVRILENKVAELSKDKEHLTTTLSCLWEVVSSLQSINAPAVPCLEMSEPASCALSDDYNIDFALAMPKGLPDPEINGLLDTMPDSKFTSTPCDISNKLSDTMPHGLPDAMPDGLPDAMPNSLLDNMLYDLPDTMLNDLPDALPNGLPDTAPKNMPSTMFNESDAVPTAITIDGLKPATLEDVQKILAESHEELRNFFRQDQG